MEILLSDKISNFEKYWIIYTLRNKEDKKSIYILGNLLKRENTEKTTALMRHELCFILGNL